MGSTPALATIRPTGVDGTKGTTMPKRSTRAVIALLFALSLIAGFTASGITNWAAPAPAAAAYDTGTPPDGTSDEYTTDPGYEEPPSCPFQTGCSGSSDSESLVHSAVLKNISKSGTPAFIACRTAASDYACASSSPKIAIYPGENSRTKPSPDWPDTDGFYCGTGQKAHVWGSVYNCYGVGLPSASNPNPARFIKIKGCGRCTKNVYIEKVG